MIGNAEVVAAGLEEIDPLKGTETAMFSSFLIFCDIIRKDRASEGDGNLEAFQFTLPFVN